MANKAKLNLTSAGSGMTEHLSRSLAALQGSVLAPLKNKGGVGRVGNCQPASETPLEEPIDQKDLDPTRYGDWEHKGRCIDF